MAASTSTSPASPASARKACSNTLPRRIQHNTTFQVRPENLHLHHGVDGFLALFPLGPFIMHLRGVTNEMTRYPRAAPPRSRAEDATIKVEALTLCPDGLTLYYTHSLRPPMAGSHRKSLLPRLDYNTGLLAILESQTKVQRFFIQYTERIRSHFRFCFLALAMLFPLLFLGCFQVLREGCGWPPAGVPSHYGVITICTWIFYHFLVLHLFHFMWIF